MAGFKYWPILSGWDDEKVYFTEETGKTWCVSDHPDLVARLIEICRDYFARKADACSSEGDAVGGQRENY